MVMFEVKLFGVLYLMTMFPMLTQGEPQEGVARRFLPSKDGASMDSSNGVFGMLRPPFWKSKEEAETEQEDEERDISHDDERKIWETVMDRVAHDVPTSDTRDVTEEQPSKIPSTMPGLPTEVDPKAGGSDEIPEEDVSQDAEVTTVPKLDEPVESKATKEEFIPPHKEEESVPREITEEAPRSKRVHEETATRESAPHRVEALSHRRPIDGTESAEAPSTPTENKNSHHIGHNLKVVTWTLAGVCLSVVVIGNFLGIYFSYIKPRMSQPTLL